jgi:hypothetical protein
MLYSSSLVQTGRMPFLALMLIAVVLSGCKSKQDAALDQASKQATASGQAQQVVSVDKNGTTTTTLIQPPAAGQKIVSIATTTVPPLPGAPIPATSGPIISAVPLKVSIPAGTNLSIRIDQRISVKNSRSGDGFTGEIVDPILASDNRVLLPKGTQVAGVVEASHRRGHFKGRSLLSLRLTSLTLNGTQYPLDTQDLARSKKGKGKRSAAIIGGGAGLGMLVGGLASGGTGLAVGGLIGGGAGTAVAGLTGNRDLDIPAESILKFRLADDLTVQPGM